MRYAEVAVNFPVTRPTFCYIIPSNLNTEPGQAIWVPFGSRNLAGIVVELSEQPSVEKVREISGVISARPLLSPLQIELARWISQRYLSPLFDCLALMLPPGFGNKNQVKPKTSTYVRLEVERDKVATEIDRLNKSRAFKQAKLLEFLEGQTRPILVSIVRKYVSCSLGTIKALAQRRIISLERVDIRRDPLSHLDVKHELPPDLTP